MPARAISGVAQAVMSAPSKGTAPADACQSPMIVRSGGVLPAPFRPSSMVNAPRGTARSTPCRMWYGPMCVFTPDRLRSGGASDIRHSQIGLLHHRQRDHARRIAVGDEFAVVQHDNAVGERAHHIHLMLDQKDGAVAPRLDRLDEIEDDRHLV